MVDTTIISWSYYGVKSFDFLVGDYCKKTFWQQDLCPRLYQILFIIITALGSVLSLSVVVDFSDMLVLAMAVPRN